MCNLLLVKRIRCIKQSLPNMAGSHFIYCMFSL